MAESSSSMKMLFLSLVLLVKESVYFEGGGVLQMRQQSLLMLRNSQAEPALCLLQQLMADTFIFPA